MLLTIQTTTNIEYHPYNLCRDITETVIIAAIVHDDFHIWYVLVTHIYFFLLLFGIFGFKMLVFLVLKCRLNLLLSICSIVLFLFISSYYVTNLYFLILYMAFGYLPSARKLFLCLHSRLLSKHSNGSWADIRYLLAVIRSCSFVSIYHLLSDLFGHSDGSCYYKLIAILPMISWMLCVRFL